jgi:hypothetical protein
MSRRRIVVFAALILLLSPAALARTARRSAPPPEAELSGRGFWGAVACASCLGSLLGAAFFEPGLPSLFDEYGSAMGACLGVCGLI